MLKESNANSIKRVSTCAILFVCFLFMHFAGCGKDDSFEFEKVVLNGIEIPEEKIVRDTSGNVSEIYLTNMGISDSNCLMGIENYAYALIKIEISGNPLTSLNLDSVSTCSQLKWLFLFNNQLESIDLTPVEHLGWLGIIYLSDNQLRHIILMPLAGSAVHYLYLEDNPVDSILCAEICSFIAADSWCIVSHDCLCEWDTLIK